ncbi:hypothetical protein OKW32_006670 [Paraburkholderia youngii]
MRTSVKGCSLPALILITVSARRRVRAGGEQASGEETAEWTGTPGIPVDYGD